MLIAVFNILGALLVTSAFWNFLLFISRWKINRNKKSESQYFATKLGVAVEDLGDVNLNSKILELASERFSIDHLSNRLSDLCGAFQVAWVWLGFSIQIIILLGVIWLTFTDSLTNSINAWWIVIVGVFFWIISALFSFICHILTGRYPGQAKKSRTAMAQFLSTQRK